MKYLSRTIIALALGLASLSGVAANGSLTMITTVLTKLGQPVGLMHDEVQVTPLEVAEDTRCGAWDHCRDVPTQLIAKVRVAHHGKVQELNFTLGTPVYLEGIGTITLAAAGIRAVFPNQRGTNCSLFATSPENLPVRPPCGPAPSSAKLTTLLIPAASKVQDYEFMFNYDGLLRHEETCREEGSGLRICSLNS